MRSFSVFDNVYQRHNTASQQKHFFKRGVDLVASHPPSRMAKITANAFDRHCSFTFQFLNRYVEGGGHAPLILQRQGTSYRPPHRKTLDPAFG